MSSSANEDQELRNNAAVEDSDAMTIEFLRSRLLSERSISKTARQRADELAKRVTELEEQLQFVTFQRKKAEKATSEVLAILENCEVSDVSEGFDSCSDESEAPHEIKARNVSNGIKFKKNEAEAYSSSEFYTQSTGRSLSWKSSKKSQHSVEKKKHVMESVVRRRASSISVPSNSSSPRRAGKSCRKIHRRDTRLPEELPTDGLEQLTCRTELSNCSDGGQYELREIIGRENEHSFGQQNLCSNPKRSSRSSLSNYENMESALKHQVQLIGQYEAEEKAQNEWEEDFRKNNTNSQQDSCEIGNHSDVTEDRYDIKSPELLHNDVPINSKQEAKQEANDEPVITRLDEELLFSGDVPSRPDPINMSSQDRNFSNGVSCEPSSSEISYPKPKDTAKQELSRNHNESSNELIVAPPEAANDLASVLEELRRAKLSLNQKLNSSPVLTEGTSKPETSIMNGFKVPHTPPGLFRLPTDYQYPATTITNHPINNERSGFSCSPITRGSNLLSVTSVDSSFAFSGANHLGVGAQSSVTGVSPEIASNRNLFRTIPSQPISVGIESGLPPQMHLSQPRTSQLDPYLGTAVSSDRSSYPYFVNSVLCLPLNEGTSRTFSNSETGLPPLSRVSLYADVGRRNMQM